MALISYTSCLYLPSVRDGKYALPDSVYAVLGMEPRMGGYEAHSS